MKHPINTSGLLAGKVAVVTGASRGIGDAIAKRFAMEGAKVVVSARTVEEGDHYLPGSIKQTVADINAAGGIPLFWDFYIVREFSKSFLSIHPRARSTTATLIIVLCCISFQFESVSRGQS